MLIKMWKARRARKTRERIDCCKGIFRALELKERDELRDRMTIEVYSGFFRNQGLIDMCNAAIEVLGEEIAMSDRAGKPLH